MLIIILFLCYSQKGKMSQSTLPDIFKRPSTTPLIARKQGGPFSLNLNYHSVDKYQTVRSGFGPGDQTYATINGTKRRSVSTASMRPKQSISRSDSNRKVDTARDKMLVTLKEDVEYWTKTPIKQSARPSIINLSSFPY